MRTTDDILVVLGSLMMIDSALGHQCYVCDSGSQEDLYQLKKTFPLVTSFPSCFGDVEEDKESFLKVCPKEQQAGCLTKFQGGSVMRTCAPIKVDDCKEANGVTYCYCKGDSCNNPERELAIPGFNHDGTREGHSEKDGDHTSTTKKHSGSGHFENQFMPGHSAPSITKFSASFLDEDDNVEDMEGSVPVHTPFYYYDDDNGPSYPRYQNYNYEYRDVDTEYGDQESTDSSDTTDPPPFIMEEIPENTMHNINRGKDISDIIFEPEKVFPKHVEDTREKLDIRGTSFRMSPNLLLLPNLLSLYLLSKL